MPTDSLKRILDRNLAKADARYIIDVAAPLLKEQVNYATNMIGRWIYGPNGVKEIDLCPLSLLLHIVQMTDGIEVLISECCPVSAIPLARSSFEGMLQLEYMLKSEEAFESRAKAYAVSHHMERRKIVETHDTTTQRGKDFENARTNNSFAKYLPFSDPEKIKRELARIDKVLSREEYRSIWDKYLEGNYNYWFSLDDGPPNYERLASKLDKGIDYYILYKQWSATSHAEDTLRFIGVASSGDGLTIEHIRNPRDVATISFISYSHINRSLMLIAKKYFKDELPEMKKWIDSEVWPLHNQLLKIINSAQDNA